MDNIESYFNGERLQCLIGLVFSVICVSASVYFLISKKPFLTGMAYSLLPLSIILLIICVGVIIRVPADIKRVSTFYNETSEKIQTEEIPRMEKVLNNFNVVKKVEISFLLIGSVLVVMFWRNELISGIAIGLVVMGISLYIFDNIAESRGDSYIQFLISL
jgi:ABC-type uncharacterized transport system permease subunit